MLVQHFSLLNIDMNLLADISHLRLLASPYLNLNPIADGISSFSRLGGGGGGSGPHPENKVRSK